MSYSSYQSYYAKSAPCLPYLAVLIGMYGLHSAWAAVGIYHLGMAVVIRGQWRVRRTSPWRVLLALGGGIGAGAALYVCWPFMAPAGFGARLAHFGLTPAAWPWFFGYFVVMNGWLEEGCWRGLLGSPARGVTWYDLLFAGYHLLVLAPFIYGPWLPAALIVLTGAGWLWRQVARMDGSLTLPILSHFAADLGIMLVAWHFALHG